jgi:hypothetical protein
MAPVAQETLADFTRRFEGAAARVIRRPAGGYSSPSRSSSRSGSMIPLVAARFRSAFLAAVRRVSGCLGVYNFSRGSAVARPALENGEGKGLQPLALKAVQFRSKVQRRPLHANHHAEDSRRNVGFPIQETGRHE